VTVGTRTLLAATCLSCGILKPGGDFKRHKRNKRDKVAYIDRRCSQCKWKLMESRRDH